MGWKSLLGISVGSLLLAMLCLAFEAGVDEHGYSLAGIFALTHVGVLGGFVASTFRNQEKRIAFLEQRLREKT